MNDRSLPTWVPAALTSAALFGPLVALWAGLMSFVGTKLGQSVQQMPSWFVYWKGAGAVFGPLLAIFTLVTWKANSAAPENNDEPTAWLSYEWDGANRVLIYGAGIALVVLAAVAAYVLSFVL